MKDEPLEELREEELEEIFRKSDKRELRRLIKRARSWKVNGEEDAGQSHPKNGHVDSRRAGVTLIKMFVDSVTRGEPIDRELLKYFAGCFTEYLDSDYKDPQWPRFMNTYKSRGHPRYKDRNDQLILSYAEHLLAGGNRESFLDEVIHTTPEYWKGAKPTEESLSKVLPAINSKDIKVRQAIIQALSQHIPDD